MADPGSPKSVIDQIFRLVLALVLATVALNLFVSVLCAIWPVLAVVAVVGCLVLAMWWWLRRRGQRW